ncbi:SH3 domain-containing protein [Streptomyces sp. NPDC017890]|uniref:SH3 domain-containing protein n=1 Tax=Streptomyces sp. NPDC017890 TaxID=3365015 RepID=UPI00378D55D4
MSVDQISDIEGGDEKTTAETTVKVTTAAATAAVSYPVAPGYRLNVRSGPGTNYSVVRALPEGARVQINCQTTGTRVSGPYGTSNIWDSIGSGQYVSDAYIRTGSDGYVAPRC